MVSFLDICSAFPVTLRDGLLVPRDLLPRLAIT